MTGDFPPDAALPDDPRAPIGNADTASPGPPDADPDPQQGLDVAAAASRDATGTPEVAGEADSPAPPAPPALAPASDRVPAAATPPVPPANAGRPLAAEPPEDEIEVPRARLAAQTRRDFVLFALGLLAAGTGAWVLLPERARGRFFPGPVNDVLDTLATRTGLGGARREQLLDRALTFDDDVAEALYSRDRSVRTYAPSQAQPLRNNYHGATPTAAMLAGWTLELSGLASGAPVRLTLEDLRARFALRAQTTRLVCVEGWSAIASWGGIRFADLLAAYPPAPGTRWVALRSEVGRDGSGRPDPYYVSLDLGTARHPQSLLATQHGGRPLTLAHGWPLRLVAPVKLGLKNIKAITHIEYSAQQPPDYWNERGYSKYDGL